MITDTTKSIARFPRMLTINSIAPGYFFLPRIILFHLLKRTPEGNPIDFVLGKIRVRNPRGKRLLNPYEIIGALVVYRVPKSFHPNP